MPAVKKKIPRQQVIEELMSPAAQKKIEREIEKKVATYELQASERGEWARKILKAQDEKTRVAVREMVAAMENMAGGNNYITVSIGRAETQTVRVEQSLYDDLRLWIAVRLCIAAYDWGIQVAGFHPVRKISKKASAR